ncbi:MAG TPA: PilZ domain-containing protein [Polyangia bacterium]
MGQRSPEELAEFAALSAKVAEKTATVVERERWRVLRGMLAGPPPPPASVRSPAPPRAHSRAAVSAARKLRVSYAPVKELHVSFAEEVSAGGLRVTVHEHLEVGTELVLRLALAGPNDPEPITTVARVAWSRREGGHFQCGLELHALRPEDRERLDAYGHQG